MEREEPGGGSAHRLHPLSPLFEIGRSFFRIVVPGLVVLFLAAGNREEVWYMLAFLPAVVLALVRYFTLRYRLIGDHLVLREGLFFRRTRHIPLARIQNIDTVQNPLHQLLGVAEVRIETAGGKEPEAVLRVLSVKRLEEIRAGVFAERGGAAAARVEEEASEGPRERRGLFRMRPIDVVLFGLLSQKGLALLGGALVLVWELDLWERLRTSLQVDSTALAWLLSPWALVVEGALFLFVLQGLTVGWAFLTLHGFRIERSKDDLRTTCGLWTRQTATIPRYRIQFLSVRESWLQRLFGRLSVKILTAGGDSTSESQVSRKWLVPLAEKDELARILAQVQPEVRFEGIAWQAVHPRARRRMFVRWTLFLLVPVGLVARHSLWWAAGVLAGGALLAFVMATIRRRRLGYAVTDGAVLLRDGVLDHVRSAVRFSKIQSVSLTQNPFDRRYRMATLHVDTAGAADAKLSFAIPYLPLVAARRLMERLVRASAPLAFRW